MQSNFERQKLDSKKLSIATQRKKFSHIDFSYNKFYNYGIQNSNKNNSVIAEEYELK